MSKEFKTVLVRDNKIELDSSITYSIERGAAQILTQQQASQSNVSTSTVNFTYNVGNQSTLISNKMYYQCDLVVALQFSGVPIGKMPLQYGLTDAFRAYALYWALQTSVLDLCNNAKSVNFYNDFPSILRSCEESLRGYDKCPSMQDSYWRSYQDSIGAINSPLSSYSNFDGRKDCPNGAFPVLISTTAPNPNPGGLLAAPLVSPVPSTGANQVQTVYIQLSATYPILNSPLCVGKAVEKAMKGLNTIKLDLNFGSGLWNKVWASANPWNITVTPITITNNNILFNQYELHEDMIPISPLNVLPYYEFNSFIFPINQTLSYANSIVNPTNNLLYVQPKNMPTTALSGIQSLQINIVPDALYLSIRKQRATVKSQDADCYCPIQSFSLTLGSASGLEATNDMTQTYDFNRENYKSSWKCYNGFSQCSYGQTGILVSTVGSYVVLEFGKDIEMRSFSLASGVLVNTNFQITNVQVFNNVTSFENTVNNNQPLALEAVVSFLYSGMYSILNGTSTYNIGVLTQEMVANAVKNTPEQDIIESSQEKERMYGGKSHMYKIKTHKHRHHHKHGGKHKPHLNLAYDSSMENWESGAGRSAGRRLARY